MRPTIAPEDVETFGQRVGDTYNETLILAQICKRLAWAMNDIEEMRKLRRDLELIARKRGAK